MEKFFKLKERNTTVTTEIMAGLTTFMTMAYILIVNPNILSASGMSWGGVFTATAVSSAVATLTMALLANYPFALAPGMGLNAFFAFTVGMKYGWQVALVAVFVEGIIFIVLSVFRIREAVFTAIPKNLKLAVGAGIGLFIAFIGMVNGGLVKMNIPDSPVALGDLGSISVLLMLAGVVITMILLGLKIRGALLWGILATWIVGIICQLGGLYVVNPDAGMYSLIPNGIVSLPPSIAGNTIIDAFSHVSGGLGVGILEFIAIMFAFLFVDVFDTVGTVIGVSEKAGFIDRDGNLPKIKEVLLSDAIGTTFGAVMGTSTVTTYVESASGVADGGRTGLTSLTVAALFVLSLFLSPIFSAIPSFATAPALVLVGFFMIQSVVKIDFSDPTEGIPAFMAIAMMPLAYSIAEGIIFGILSYVVMKVGTGRRNEVSAVMYVVAALFVAKLVAQAVMGY
jgi:AGZA family xanthine/uracil permease-like MFS transporter